MTATTPSTIAEAAASLRSGERSSVSLVEASLAAIEREQPRTNAFTLVEAERARADAATADRERSLGMDRGPLHGIPISLKDLIDEGGVVTTAGSHVLDARVAAEDAPVVKRLREQGAVIIGRTNLHQFALGTTSEDTSFGPVRNPLDPARSAGGSSGGSAAAVATGMGLASIGSDTGGSIRIPSAACGIVGLKPSVLDVPTTGVIPLSTTFDHVGPLAKSVQDAAWIWAVLSGRAPGPVAKRDATRTKLVRLGGYFDVMTADVRGPFEQALQRLEAAGMTFTTTQIAETSGIMTAYVNIVLPEAAAWHAPFLETRKSGYSETVHSRLLSGRDIKAVDYLAARETCARLRADVDRALGAADCLVLPTLPLVAPLLGADDVTLSNDVTLPVRSAMLRNTQLFNMTGHPAISLPLRGAGLPAGLQLVGRLDATAALLATAALCEEILRA